MKDTSIFKKNQIASFAIVFIYLTALYLFPVSYTLTTGFWTISMYSAQLIVAKYMQYFIERRTTNEKVNAGIPQAT